MEVSQGAVLGDHPVPMVAFKRKRRGLACWALVRVVLFIFALIQSFNLGRSSVEFDGTWTILIFGVISLVGALIGLAAADLLRVKPNQS